MTLAASTPLSAHLEVASGRGGAWDVDASEARGPRPQGGGFSRPDIIEVFGGQNGAPTGGGTPERGATRERLATIHDAIRNRQETPRAVHHCGRVPLGGAVWVTVADREGRRPSASVSGVQRCGLPHECPSCRRTMSMERAAVVQQVLEDARRRGWSLYLVTLTVRHGPQHRIRDTVVGLRRAWTRLTRSRAWFELRHEIGGLEVIRGLETTYGENGAHPHIHAVFGVPPVDGAGPMRVGTRRDSEAELDIEGRLIDVLDARWAPAVVATMGPDHAPDDAHGVDVQAARDATGAGGYIAKLGLELTLESKGSRAGRTPLDVLSDWVDHRREEDWRLWRAHADAWRGERLLTWSRGWGGAWREEAEAHLEAELEATTTTTTVAEVPHEDWSVVVRCAPREVRALVVHLEEVADRSSAWEVGWGALLSRARDLEWAELAEKIADRVDSTAQNH